MSSNNGNRKNGNIKNGKKRNLLNNLNKSGQNKMRNEKMRSNKLSANTITAIAQLQSSINKFTNSVSKNGESTLIKVPKDVNQIFVNISNILNGIISDSTAFNTEASIKLRDSIASVLLNQSKMAKKMYDMDVIIQTLQSTISKMNKTANSNAKRMSNVSGNSSQKIAQLQQQYQQQMENLNRECQHKIQKLVAQLEAKNKS